MQTQQWCDNWRKSGPNSGFKTAGGLKRATDHPTNEITQCFYQKPLLLTSHLQHWQLCNPDNHLEGINRSVSHQMSNDPWSITYVFLPIFSMEKLGEPCSSSLSCLVGVEELYEELTLIRPQTQPMHRPEHCVLSNTCFTLQLIN